MTPGLATRLSNDCAMGPSSQNLEFQNNPENISPIQANYSKTCVKLSLKNRQNKDLYDKW